MQGDPIHLQSPETRYRFRSDTSVPLVTGMAGGRQWLLVSGCRLGFDVDGRLETTEDIPGGEASAAADLGLDDGPIDVLRFWLPDRLLGISDFPLGCPDLPGDPADFGEPVWEWLRATPWADGEMFTLQLGDNAELWVDREGRSHLLSKRG